MPCRRQPGEAQKFLFYFNELVDLHSAAVSSTVAGLHGTFTRLYAAKMLREKLNEALKTAMKSQDKRRTATVRLILAAIKDRDIATRTADNPEPVSDEDILGILAKMVKQRHESVAIYEQAGREELARQEAEEIEIIESFLPQQFSADEVHEACVRVVEEIGANGIKDMGKAMGTLKSRFAGQMDFGSASKIIKELLA